MAHGVSIVNCVASGGRCTLGPYGSLHLIRQMDLVMWIVNERDVFTTLITRYGESLCYGRLPYTYDEALFIFSITSSRYRVGTAKTQGRFSSHCCTCIIMGIPPITVMKLHRAVRKFQLHKSLMRVTPDPFPIFEGWVRQRQTRPSTVILAAHAPRARFCYAVELEPTSLPFRARKLSTHSERNRDSQRRAAQ